MSPQPDDTNCLTLHLPPACPVGPPSQRRSHCPCIPFLQPPAARPQVCPCLAGIFLVLLLVLQTDLTGASATHVTPMDTPWSSSAPAIRARPTPADLPVQGSLFCPVPTLTTSPPMLGTLPLPVHTTVLPTILRTALPFLGLQSWVFPLLLQTQPSLGDRSPEGLTAKQESH